MRSRSITKRPIRFAGWAFHLRARAMRYAQSQHNRERRRAGCAARSERAKRPGEHALRAANTRREWCPASARPPDDGCPAGLPRLLHLHHVAQAACADIHVLRPAINDEAAVLHVDLEAAVGVSVRVADFASVLWLPLANIAASGHIRLHLFCGLPHSPARALTAACLQHPHSATAQAERVRPAVARSTTLRAALTAVAGDVTMHNTRSRSACLCCRIAHRLESSCAPPAGDGTK